MTPLCSSNPTTTSYSIRTSNNRKLNPPLLYEPAIKLLVLQFEICSMVNVRLSMFIIMMVHDSSRGYSSLLLLLDSLLANYTFLYYRAMAGGNMRLEARLLQNGISFKPSCSSCPPFSRLFLLVPFYLTHSV